jgi:hypothetical protein
MSFDFRRISIDAVSASMVIILLLSFGAKAQERASQVFDPVPPQSRAGLVERLQEYVEYEKTGQYAKLFELLYKVDSFGEKITSKELYVAARQKVLGQRGTLREFLPIVVIDLTLNDGETPIYSITGLAKVKCEGEQTIDKKVTVFAKFENGNWYFSEMLDSHFHT